MYGCGNAQEQKTRCLLSVRANQKGVSQNRTKRCRWLSRQGHLNGDDRSTIRRAAAAHAAVAFHAHRDSAVGRPATSPSKRPANGDVGTWAIFCARWSVLYDQRCFGPRHSGNLLAGRLPRLAGHLRSRNVHRGGYLEHGDIGHADYRVGCSRRTVQDFCDRVHGPDYLHIAHEAEHVLASQREWVHHTSAVDPRARDLRSSDDDRHSHRSAFVCFRGNACFIVR